MKTTVNLPDELLREAQELARREGTTLREMIETGLRALVDASVDGDGMQPEFRGAPWSKVRDTIYDTSA
jgi:metal-responsive CopG/Arc/MetJ family transcriptional regulator